MVEIKEEISREEKGKLRRRRKERRDLRGRKRRIKQNKTKKEKRNQKKRGKKIEDTVEEVEEEVYHDAEEEERDTEESSKEEEKEEDMESGIEVIKQIGVNRQRRNGTRTECNCNAIGPNDEDKIQARRAKPNESLRWRRAGKVLTNDARSRVCSQTSTRAGRAGCTTGQTVN